MLCKLAVHMNVSYSLLILFHSSKVSLSTITSTQQQEALTSQCAFVLTLNNIKTDAKIAVHQTVACLAPKLLRVLEPICLT